MTPEDMLRDKCWKAERLGLEITPLKPGLQFKEGFYSPSGNHCTNLEAVVLGEENCSGILLTDAARVLGVSEDWVRGFIAGQNVSHVPHNPDTDIRNGHVRKFTDAEKLIADL